MVCEAWNVGSDKVAIERGRGKSTSMISRTRPGRGVITMMRSASNTASGMEWVMNSTVFGRSDQIRSKLEAHLVARQRVERRERLVHQQNIRIEQQRPGDGDALLHAAG